MVTSRCKANRTDSPGGTGASTDDGTQNMRVMGVTREAPGGWVAEPPEARTVTVQHGSKRKMLADLVELFAWRNALVELVSRDLKVRYRRSMLGQVWSMLNPLLTMAVTAIVFSTFFRFAINYFPVYVLSAQLVWGFFSQATVAGTTSVLGSSGLARRLYLPPALFPLATICSAAINLLLSLVPLFLIVLVTGRGFSWALLFLPVSLALTFLFTFGLALILSAASVFFHDTVHTIQVLLAAWMYLTPIFYPIEIIPPEWNMIIHLNPVYHLVTIFRTPIYAGTLPDPVNIAAATAYAVGTAAFGWWYFERSRNAFPGY